MKRQEQYMTNMAHIAELAALQDFVLWVAQVADEYLDAGEAANEIVQQAEQLIREWVIK